MLFCFLCNIIWRGDSHLCQGHPSLPTHNRVCCLSVRLSEASHRPSRIIPCIVPSDSTRSNHRGGCSCLPLSSQHKRSALRFHLSAHSTHKLFSFLQYNFILFCNILLFASVTTNDNKYITFKSWHSSATVGCDCGCGCGYMDDVVKVK